MAARAFRLSDLPPPGPPCRNGRRVAVSLPLWSAQAPSDTSKAAPPDASTVGPPRLPPPQFRQDSQGLQRHRQRQSQLKSLHLYSNNPLKKLASLRLARARISSKVWRSTITEGEGNRRPCRRRALPACRRLPTSPSDSLTATLLADGEPPPAPCRPGFQSQRAARAAENYLPLRA